MLNNNPLLAERLQTFRLELACLSKQVQSMQETLKALSEATSDCDETASECLATDNLWTDRYLKDELFYVMTHDSTVHSDMATRAQNVLGAVCKHMTREIFKRHGREIPEELLHFVGQFGDGFLCGVFYRSQATGEVHARCVWEAEKGVQVDNTHFEAVIPNGEGGWKPYYADPISAPLPDAQDDNPDTCCIRQTT